MMNAFLRSAMALAATAFAAQAVAQVTFYEREGFQGQTFTTDRQIGNFERFGFNDRASSVEVFGARWEVCDDSGFRGRCVVLQPGRYPSLASMGMDNRVSSVRAADSNAPIGDNRYAPARVAPQITFYEAEGYRGRNFTTQAEIENFRRSGFNDLGASVEVLGDQWEVCEGPGFRGRCVILLPGRYPSLASMTLDSRVSSARAANSNPRVEDNRYAPAPVMGRDGRDFRRRSDERIYEVNVSSVRAVVATPEQRCWVERGQAVQPQRSVNVPGAIAGALIGGIVGHQFGNGGGQDIATAGGAVAGGFVGANVGRLGGGQQAQTQDIQRCDTVPSQAPTYWDVTYYFRGQEHRVQMTTPPGPTITVNEQGEPRA